MDSRQDAKGPIGKNRLFRPTPVVVAVEVAEALEAEAEEDPEDEGRQEGGRGPGGTGGGKWSVTSLLGGGGGG